MSTNLPAVRNRKSTPAGLEPIVKMVTDSLPSAKSKRDYRRALVDFLDWYGKSGRTEFNKAAVQAYAQELQDTGMGAASINQRLSAIRKLAREAADNATIGDQVSNGIQRVSGIPQRGVRTGNWLTLDQAQALINAPDVSTLAGLRDRALLAVLIGCGLRRAEAASLTFEHVQQREGRWAIVDLVGKRNKSRTVPMPAWCKAAVDAWADAAGIGLGRIFRPVNKGNKLGAGTMTDQAIYYRVDRYSQELALGIAAHDLRRTFAKLARDGGSEIEQIQLNLGHDSLATTERYLGSELSFTDAPGDRIKIQL